MTATGARSPVEGTLAGHYAGVVTRAAAYALDGFLGVALYGVLVGVIVFLWNVLANAEIAAPAQSNPLWSVGLAAWLLVYYGYCWSVAGKTPGKAVLGLRIVASDGTDLTTRRALLRLVAYPLSPALLGAGFAVALFQRERRALHDLLAGTAVVYDWDARAARLRFLSRRARRSETDRRR